MRGFETLLAASVATAGVTQIALMVARSSHHVDAIPVEHPVSDCCQYRTWPVENSFWTFPFSSEFHPTEQGYLNRPASVGLLSRTAPDGNKPPGDSVYVPAGQGTGPEATASFPWIDLVDSRTPAAAEDTNQTPQEASMPQWVGSDSVAARPTRALAPSPMPGLFLAPPGPGANPPPAPSPTILDIPTPLPSPSPEVTPPGPGDLPQIQVVGDLGGPGGDPSGGTPTPSDVPEPAALIIVLTSLLGLAAARRPLRA